LISTFGFTEQFAILGDCAMSNASTHHARTWSGTRFSECSPIMKIRMITTRFGTIRSSRSSVGRLRTIALGKPADLVALRNSIAIAALKRLRDVSSIISLCVRDAAFAIDLRFWMAVDDPTTAPATQASLNGFFEHTNYFPAFITCAENTYS